MDIGSAASIGKGLSVLGTAIGVNDVLDALNVVVSTIEHSDVTGNTGGFAVKASNVEGDVLGDAGGFAGKISGGHIQDSNANNFSYIIGQIAAGGYVGDYVPGDVASVLGDASILNGLVSVKETLASVAQDFVPTIRNSSTSCIPCGGAVRAQAASTESVQRGMAGGYVGHNEGGHIWGSNTKKWKGKDYTGSTSNCQAIRIRSVYGAEIAGGFTGFMECADRKLILTMGIGKSRQSFRSFKYCLSNRRKYRCLWTTCKIRCCYMEFMGEICWKIWWIWK